MRKVIKTVYILSVVIVLIIFINGCQNQTTKEKEDPIVMGVSMADMDEVVYPLMKEAMYDNKDRDNVKIIWRNADNDLAKQRNDINYLLEQKVDIIIFQAVNTEKGQEIISKVDKEKIPVIAMDRVVTNAKLAGYITADSFRVGVEQAQFLADQIEHKGQIIILKGDKNNNVTDEITYGNKSVLKNEPKIDIVVEKYHKNWSPEAAAETTKKALENFPDINGIIANNSDMILAAIKILKEKDLNDKIVTVGADANKEACIAIARGEHEADVDKMPYLIGLTAYHIALSILNGEEWLYEQRYNNGEYDVPVLTTPVQLINKYNLIQMENRWGDFIEKETKAAKD